MASSASSITMASRASDVSRAISVNRAAMASEASRVIMASIASVTFALAFALAISSAWDGEMSSSATLRNLRLMGDLRLKI